MAGEDTKDKKTEDKEKTLIRLSQIRKAHGINQTQLAKMLGVSRPVAYELTKREGFPAIRIGERRIIIPVDKLNEWLSREAERA